MSLFRLLYLTTTIGIGGCLFVNFADRWKQSLIKVNAQLQSDEDQHKGQQEAPEKSEQGQHTSAAVAGGGDHLLPSKNPEKVGPDHKKKKLDWTPFSQGGPIFPHPEIQTRTLLSYKDFILCYDNLTRTANWTLEHITKENAKPLKEFPPAIRKDLRIPEQFRSDTEDFKAVPVKSKQKFKQQLMASMALQSNDSFDICVCTNIVPQAIDPAKSKTLWDELHDYIIHLTKHHKNIYVLSGALYLPTCKPDGKWFVHYELIGQKNVAVPSHYFKVILAEIEDGIFRLECFKFENKLNDIKDLSDYHVARHDLEKETGFVIFSSVTDSMITEFELQAEFAKRYSPAKQQQHH